MFRQELFLQPYCLDDILLSLYESSRLETKTKEGVVYP